MESPDGKPMEGSGSGAATVSRDFWMPDHSCTVCYDCDSPFNFYTRRHHCRLCGRIFCAKCTSNFISADPKNAREEGERLRVCNYCYKQREQEQETSVVDNGLQVLTPSLSTISLGSSKSSSSGNSSTSTVSVAYSTGAYQRTSYCSDSSPRESLGTCHENHEMVMPTKETESVVDIRDPSPKKYNHFMSRSDDDEDDEYDTCHSHPGTPFQTSANYYGPVEYHESDQGYRYNKVHPAEENVDTKVVCPPPCFDTEIHASLGTGKVAEDSGPDNRYECDSSSSIYDIRDPDAEPVDFENNGLLWDPPEPEDEDDEREALLFDDDDDEDATGEWGYMHPSNSFGSGEYRSKDRTSEEHRKVMKNVVGGHFRALIAQLLEGENLPVAEEDDKENWFQIVTALCWEAANILKPDTSEGGGMDPGGYVKIKCIACGRRSESKVVKGVVCKKNVAHRRMTSKIEKPRFLILGGALEYHRVTNLLSSFDTLLQQEMDHLKMAVAKIDAHHPNVLLVEKSVSRFAQDYLLAKNISLVLNLKRPLLERIARCTGAQIVPSIDHLSSQKLGSCDLFHVEKFYEEHESAGQGAKKIQKTLMFFEGCPKPLGCTVLLKGASKDELKKVKHVVQYGVFAAYHLALETSFLADEGASITELPLKSPSIVPLLDKPSKNVISISKISGSAIPATSMTELTSNIRRPNGFNSISTLNNFKKLEVNVPPYLTKDHYSQMTESLSNYNNYSFNMSALRVTDNNRAIEPQCRASFTYYSPVVENKPIRVGFLENPEDESFRTSYQGNLDLPVTTTNCFDSLGSRDGIVGTDNQVHIEHMMEVQSSFSELGISHQNENHNDRNALSKEGFPSPSDYQSILVSLSSRCVWKGTVCERPHLFRIKYYGNHDKPLGRFLRVHLFDQNYRCPSCEMPSEAHVHCYTHRQGSLTISVRKLPDILLPGERDGKIWMWHRCLRCPRINGFPPATRRVVMSEAAWGLSFGKFLELSFSNHAAASRVATCGHSLHRDCLRFYGYGKMVACFRYASINLHCVYLPPPKLDFSYQHQEWVEKEAKEVADNATCLFTQVLNALHQIAEAKPKTASLDSNMKVLESRRMIVELEGMLQKERAEFESLLGEVVKREANTGQLDVLEVNKLRRQLLFLSYLWDKRLIFTVGSGSSTNGVLVGFMSKVKEKLIISNEKAVDLNQAPKLLSISVSSDTSLSDSEKGSKRTIDHHEGSFGRPNQLDVGYQRRDEQVPSKQCKPSLSTSRSSAEQIDFPESGFAVRRVVSAGQFHVAADLSGTLDAKWTGENGPVLVELSIPNTSASAVSVPYDLEQPRPDETQSILSPFTPRDGDSVEDFSRWFAMPFQNFYRLVNKNTGVFPRFDTLGDYNPVYISLFRELVRQGGARLLLPLGVNNTVIPIFDDEPTSVIAYALVSPDHQLHISDDPEKQIAGGSGTFRSFHSVDGISVECLRSFTSTDDSKLSLTGSWNSVVSDPLTYTKTMHVKVCFSDDGPPGKVKYSVTCYYAKSFDALRKTCCTSELDFIRSLSRCKKWGAQGGKSNVFFAKSLDERFIIKQVTKTELESFIKFAPEYFKYLSESISTGSPSCLAKILGIYQVTTKHVKSGKETRMDVLVMENLLFGRNVTRLYDLKGSLRSRYNSDSSGSNKVLLDQNLIESMPTSPIFVGNKAKRLLERAVWNDTSFLASIDVMDYSLLVGVDEKKHELVLGIIDFMRQYTWDKHLETWVKASGILGGPKNVSPTVVSPKQYKKRFRKAMSDYFLVVPDQWSFPAGSPGKPQSDLNEDSQDNAALEFES